MRVYLGATLADLRALHVDRVLRGPRPGTAVTAALREWYAEGDTEELEYVALTLAADDSLGLLLQRPEDPRRRAVVACDVSDTAVQPDPARGRAAVTVGDDVPLRAVAAVHVDDAAAAEAVTRTVLAWPAALTGDADAQFAVDGSHDYELLWHATQELDTVVADMGRDGPTGDEAAR